MKEYVASGANAAIANSRTPLRNVPILASAGLSAAPVADNPRVNTTAIATFENSNAPTTSIHRRNQCLVADHVQLANAIGAKTTKATSATCRISITKYKRAV